MTKTFKSENGFYQLEYPENFRITYEDNILNIFPEDNESALTVSSYYFENGVDDERFNKLFNLFVKDKDPAGEKIELNSDVHIQRFMTQQNEETIIWHICLNRNNRVLLVISINHMENEQDEIVEKYQKIHESIVILES